MRILVLTHEFPPVGGGGAQIIRDLCLGLSMNGHSLKVLTSHLKELPRAEMIDGVEVLRVPCGRKVPYQARFIEMARYVIGGIWESARVIRYWRPTVMHVHFAVPAGVIGWLLSKFSGIPYILTTHGGDVPSGASEKTAGWFRWVYPFTPPIWRAAAKVIAVSEETRKLAKKNYPVEIQVIRNGFDHTAFAGEEIQVGMPPRVIWAGRFMPEKNPIQIVQTLARLCEVPWECIMIGDGPERARVQQEIKRYQLEDRVIVTGWLSQEEVMDQFSRSDVLFMPSFIEGLPIVGLQALATGLAVVATRVGGLLNLVEPTVNGYLVDDPSGTGFIEPLRSLLTDPIKLKSFREASRQLAKRFNNRSMIQSYDEVLLEVARQTQ